MKSKTLFNQSNRKLKFSLWCFIILATISSSSLAGCLFSGTEYPVGYELAVDRDNPATIKWHREFENEYGVLPDGGAYKMAVCSFVVNPATGDFPIIAKRQFVWVASQFSYEDVHY